MNSKHISADETYYICDGCHVHFYYDDDEEGFVLCRGYQTGESGTAVDIANIREFYIPGTINGKPVISLEGDIWDGMNGLGKIIVEDDNEYFCLYQGGLYSKDMSRIYHMPPGFSGKIFYVPESVRIVYDSGLFNQSVETIVIPEGCTTILEYALACDKSLKSIYLPKSLEFIGLKAFNFSEVEDVFYAGSEQDRDKIIFIDRTLLICGAKWHYNSEIPREKDV